MALQSWRQRVDDRVHEQPGEQRREQVEMKHERQAYGHEDVAGSGQVRGRYRGAWKQHGADYRVPVRILSRLALLSLALSSAAAGQDSIVVTATRSGQLVRDQPLRVEVVPDAEIEENLTVAPGTDSTSSRACACKRRRRVSVAGGPRN